MPGFLMHLVEGEMILKEWKKYKDISEDFSEQFMLGCILPDVTSDKERTHFRPACQKNQITKYPDLSLIPALHKDRPLSPVDLGILAHLQMDTSYVTDFWQRFFIFETASGVPSVDTRQSLYVKLLKYPDIRIPLQEFFSDKWFYGEYDRINPVLNKQFHPFVPDHVIYHPENIQIKECIPDDAGRIPQVLKQYVMSSDAALSDNSTKQYSGTDEKVCPTSMDCKTKVFPYNDIVAFLHEQALFYLRSPYLKNYFI